MRRAIRGPLKRNPANPRYFTDETGEAVYLTGSHTWNNLVDMGHGDPPPRFDFGLYLDMLERLNHNFIRLWAWDMLCTWNSDETVAPHPWERTGPGAATDGKPRFDLSKFDPAYFERLKTRVAAAKERGIYVSVMLFEGWSVFTANKTARGRHLFAKGNNVNGLDVISSERDGILRDWITLDNKAVVGLQEAYVRKVIETVGGFDNVLYEICNEAGSRSHDWQEHFIGFIRECESRAGTRHMIGMTGGMATLNRRTYESSADWISPDSGAGDGLDEGYRNGGRTWGSAPFDRGDKVVLLDTDHLWGIGGDETWAWRSFCRGYNVLYMDRCDDMPTAFYHHPAWPEKFNPALRREMGAIRSFAQRMDLNRSAPDNDLASTSYCLANPGREYLIYQPKEESFAVRLSPGDYRFEWRDPSTGLSSGEGDIRASGEFTGFTPPFTGDAVIFLQKK